MSGSGSMKYWVTAIVLVMLTVAILFLKPSLRDDGSFFAGEIESRGQRLLGTEVQVGEVRVSRESGTLSLSGLRVANPGGYSNNDMISVDTVEAELEPGERLISSIRLSGVRAVVEFRGARMNFETTGERISENGADDGGDDAADSDQPTDEQVDGDEEGSSTDAADKDWRLARLDIDRMDVLIRADWTTETVEFTTDPLTLRNIGGSADDLARITALRFLDGVLVAAIDRADNERLRRELSGKSSMLQDKLRQLESDSGTRE